jgi:hypothetical protein
MPPTDADLYARLLAFAVDEGTPALTFEARLARENGWGPDYARRVVAEYRRFVFLAATAGHTVCPSEQVDQAWHLHLTDTRSYWDRLCGGVLGRPLHHTPSRGGHDEADHYRSLFARTLDSYRAAFGEDPPADVWPPADERFGDDLRAVRVNTADSWVVPKSAVRRAGGDACAVLAAAAAAAGCTAVAVGATPPGDQLRVLVALLAGAFAWGLWLRRRLRGPGPQPGDAAATLDWAAAAYLAGGRHRLATAALARLTTADLARVTPDGKEVEAVPGVAPPADLSAVEAAVLRSLPVARDDRECLTSVGRVAADHFAGRATDHRYFDRSMAEYADWCGRPEIAAMLRRGRRRRGRSPATDRGG